MKLLTSLSSPKTNSSRLSTWDWHENPYYAGYYYPVGGDRNAPRAANPHSPVPAKPNRPRREYRGWAWLLSPLKAG